MLRTPLAASILALVVVGMTTTGCGGKGAAAADTTAVPASRTPAEVVDAGQRTVEQWRQAYEVHSVDALAPLYLQDLDVAVADQGRLQRGWTAVETYLSTRVNAAKEIHITLDDLQVTALGPGAASVLATMTRETSDGVTTVTERGVLTLALRAEPDAEGGHWVIVTEHYSYPPTAQ
ncbi:MAG: nuclear transport factor 2 family protein [Kofleriaceae bacterium]|nr:nuclear transport factor 2 family protein [Myxococcales bacterium]MCB9572425.1 nuclear transport factor 2 family protein [Kofleriaceae bacterium]